MTPRMSGSTLEDRVHGVGLFDDEVRESFAQGPVRVAENERSQGGLCVGGADAHLFVGGVQGAVGYPLQDGYVSAATDSSMC